MILEGKSKCSMKSLKNDSERESTFIEIAKMMFSSFALVFSFAPFMLCLALYKCNLSPIMHRHINMLGHYHYTFILPEDFLTGELLDINNELSP